MTLLESKTLNLEVGDSSERTMDTANNPNGGNLGFSTNEGKVALRIWDMSPETSIVGALIRNKIVQHLSKQAAFLKRDHDQREKIVRRMDDILFERAPSQVHYMNLETLESRLNYLLNCHKNVEAMKTLDRDVLFLSNGSTAASCKRPHQLNLCSPDTSYHNTSISSGDSIPFEQCPIVGDVLTRSLLSDHIEKWLYRRLEAERRERAKLMGKTFSEVPAAEGLIVRVVSSVSKKLQVKTGFPRHFSRRYISFRISLQIKGLK
ncbi:uncharacterized protein A4U43_C01F28190 [Asparagus officinalis]|uniref:histone acetyltransferase n=1 Tax=Asparagus officinalis TaxID=4686 RepID=A0A5P1FV86_ASPOF|nr:uncharacterized protein LOC109829025 isoform X2 [Asparagus officinalis]ONK81357.1 uncharacterized protein A4U43_C01F28190 [Asparagus officinalis]